MNIRYPLYEGVYRILTFDLAYKNDMTSTFATQFISGSPKATCEHREKKVSCKRFDSLYKRVAAKRKYKWASGLYKNFNYEDKKGIAPACLPREKETG